jgi:ATP-dependent DNA helicase RecG
MKYPEQESSTLEFKKEIPKNEQIVKTIIGFCNQQGGKLIIGIDDDGTIVGIDEERAQEMMEYLEQCILESSFPPIFTRIYLQRIADKTLLILDVTQGSNKPYYLKKDGREKGIYIRLGRSTLRATPDMIEELKLEARNISFDAMPVYQATEDDLNMKKITQFLKNRKSARKKGASYKSITDAMLAYKIITREHNQIIPTVCGILLFGNNPQFFFPEARIMCNQFLGITISKEVLASQECLGTLDDQFQAAHDFVQSRLYTSWKIVGTRRKERLEIPDVAIREIIMNAIIHRNYHIPGPTKIAIFNNRVEVFSPGIFPGPVSQNLKAGFTYLRNIAIAKIFREMGLIESFGLGLLHTFSSYEEYGLKAPEILEGEGFIKCILPRRTPENLVVRSQSEQLPTDLSDILHFFDTATEISVADIIKTLHFTRPTATRKLAELTRKGLLEKIGKGRGVRYIKKS